MKDVGTEVSNRSRPQKPREIVTIQELTAYLTAELQKVRDCGGCSIRGILPYQQPDEDGCNWSDNVWVSTGGDMPEEYIKPHVQRIVVEARKRFNLEQERED